MFNLPDNSLELKMSFIDQAKEVLQPEQVTRLELLAMKSANLESSMEEIDEMKALKQEVVRLIANRDRQKNLSFLKDGQYDINDILDVMGVKHEHIIQKSGMTLSDIFKVLNVTKKQATQAMNEVFKKGGTTDDNGFNGVLAVYGSEDVTMGRNNREANKLVISGGEKAFVSNLTDSGREWMTKTRKATAGPYVGQDIYDGINKVAQKFKFNKETLKKELGLIKAEEKAPATQNKKQEAKKAA